MPRLTDSHGCLREHVVMEIDTCENRGLEQNYSENRKKNDMFDSFPNSEDIEYELDTVSFNPA